MENADEKVAQIYRDFYFGNGKENPAVTVRLSNIEADAREMKADVARHTLLLEGDKGLDRVMRDFVAEQKGRDQARTQSDVIWRFVVSIAITFLVGLLEWHPWR